MIHLDELLEIPLQFSHFILIQASSISFKNLANCICSHSDAINNRLCSIAQLLILGHLLHHSNRLLGVLFNHAINEYDLIAFKERQTEFLPGVRILIKQSASTISHCSVVKAGWSRVEYTLKVKS